MFDVLYQKKDQKIMMKLKDLRGNKTAALRITKTPLLHRRKKNQESPFFGGGRQPNFYSTLPKDLENQKCKLQRDFGKI